jgi:hypothetical protein
MSLFAGYHNDRECRISMLVSVISTGSMGPVPPSAACESFGEDSSHPTMEATVRKRPHISIIHTTSMDLELGPLLWGPCTRAIRNS